MPYDSESIRPLEGDAPAAQKINLRRLAKLQKLFQYSAAVVLLLLAGFIVASSWKLYSLNHEIAGKRVQRDSLDTVIAQNRSALQRQQDSIAGLQATSRALQVTLASPKNQSAAPTLPANNPLEANLPLPAEGKQIQPRVYIQIANNGQRALATDVAAALRQAGMIAPGIENMEGKVASFSSVLKYYPSGNYRQSDLDLIAQVLRNASLPALKQVAVSGRANVRPRLYEIWLGADFMKAQPRH